MDLISKEAVIEQAKASYHVAESMEQLGNLYEDCINALPSAFDGMTNGEVIKAVFPNASVFENQDNEPYPYIDVFLCGDKDMNCYRKDWWNAPYKAESEGQAN